MQSYSEEHLDKVIHKLTLKRSSSKPAPASASASATSSKPIAIFMCGPTASGKSTIKQYIAKGKNLDSYVNLDQDEVSNIFKEETRENVRQITLNHLFPRILEKRSNIIIDRTCRDVTDTINSMHLAKKSGYYIIVAFVYIDKETGISRLAERNKKGQIVPMEVFDDIYNDFQSRLIQRYFIQKKMPYNELVLFDNSDNLPKQLLFKTGDYIKVYEGKEDTNFFGITIRDLANELSKKSIKPSSSYRTASSRPSYRPSSRPSSRPSYKKGGKRGGKRNKTKNKRNKSKNNKNNKRNKTYKK